MVSCSGVSEDQVEIELLCTTRRAVSIQIVFTIKLEADTLVTTAVTALNNDVATGELATTFTEKAADRNEIVAVVSQILDTACGSCDGVIEIVTDINVSEATFIAIGALQLAPEFSVFT